MYVVVVVVCEIASMQITQAQLCNKHTYHMQVLKLTFKDFPFFFYKHI